MRSLHEWHGKAPDVRGRLEGAWGELQLCSKCRRPEGDLRDSGGTWDEEGWLG